MNILLLSNSAPNYFHFFNALAQLFAEDGATIHIAVDSHFSARENGLDKLGFATVHEFEAFFQQHRTDHAILQRYADCNLNGALLSDFERAQVYGIWGRGADLAFFDRLKSALLCFFERIFAQHQIDTVLYENVSNAFAHFALFVAQKHGAQYLGLGASRLPGRFSVSADPLNDGELARTFADIRAGQRSVPADVRQWAASYIDGIEQIVPDYMKINGLDNLGIWKRYVRRDRLRKVRSLLRHAFDGRTGAFQIGNPLLTHARLFARNARRRLRARHVRKFYQPAQTGERFLLYPLHFHPEASTSILAGAYLDEYEVIRNIAFSLPEGLRLYVKDHLSAWAYPDMAFYRRLTALPNVRLLPPEAPTKQLIKQSEAVITLTSTVGYEALLLNRPVFLFGRVFYEFHQGVQRITDIGDLWNILRAGLAAPPQWSADYNIDFVCAYYLTTLPGSLNLLQTGPAARQTAAHVYDALLKSGRIAPAHASAAASACRIGLPD